jgi:hypothetical protein
MGRSNVIIVGSVVLAPLILGAESFALYRAHRHRARTAQIAGPSEMSATPLVEAATVQPPARPAPDERPVSPPPSPTPPAVPAAADPPPETETVSDVQPDPAVERRRQLMLRRRGEVLQAADEQVFGLLHLPDEQRAAIRAVDGAYARTVQAIAQLPPGADPRGAGLDPNAERARRAAIADVLGPEATRTFTFAERRAERRVQGQYRAKEIRGR